MYLRTIAFIITVIMTAAPFAALGAGGADCSGHGGCCHGMAMGGLPEGGTVIGPTHGCCCGAAGAGNCALTADPTSRSTSWALVSHRIERQAPDGAAATDTAPSVIAPAFPLICPVHQHRRFAGDPPVYLSLMSLLR